MLKKLKRCEYCGETFQTQEVLVSHLISKHSDHIQLTKLGDSKKP